MEFGFLEGGSGIGMATRESLVARIGEIAGRGQTSHTAAFEKLKVVSTASGKGGSQDLLGIQVDHELRFLGMPLLFAAVILALLFFGRSMGCSVTSTKTNSIASSLDCNTF